MTWEDLGTVWRLCDGLFEVEEVGPNMWQPVDNTTREPPGPVTDLETAKAWCESRVALPAPDFFGPDIVVEGT